MHDRPLAVLVTGASKGIGEAVALRMHGRGWQVFAGVRRSEDGEALLARAGTERLVAVPLDVTDAEQARATAERIEAATEGAGLKGLVNNAGTAVAGPLEYLPAEELRRQLEVNVVGQVVVTQAVLPQLRRARGRIVFIGSISGRSAMPLVGAYAASKFAIEAIADALRVELMTAGVEVSIIEPGAIATPIWETSLGRAVEMLERMPPELGRYYGREIQAVRRIAERGGEGLAPAVVADAVERALTAALPPVRQVIGRDAKLRLLLERLPTRLRDRIISRRLRG